MRLKSIKLAGFKSFVDPTHVPFPRNLSAIVGPNGCGKSNVIDAVRWVMGESSAKHLRGESMADVIFNGSNSRQPVGSASIELVFDNSDGKLIGEYAAFAEISIKRKVTRDGQSQYFINGSKCRRRDVTDIFLGTGLGPRSYAIIEQGMISRLIESKPEELRVYIEEAAGISKYKERRRETENRMRHTQENLERLNDIREELERQLQHLKRQASAAEKFAEYKKEERLKSAQLNALKWQTLNDQGDAKKSAIQNAEIELEKSLYLRTNSETRIETVRLEHVDQQENFNKVQARYYEAGAEIARVEQQIKFQRERAAQVAEDKRRAEREIEELSLELEQENQKLMEVGEELDLIQPQYEEAAETALISQEALAEKEEAMHQWQHEWDEFNQQSSQIRHAAEIEQARIQQSESQLKQFELRSEKLSQESAQLRDQMKLDEFETCQQELESSQQKVNELQLQRDELKPRINDLRQESQQVQEKRSQLRVSLGEKKGIQSSLMALQQAAFGNDDDARQDWLESQGLAERPRIAELVKVVDGWEVALEHVLSGWLSGISVDDLDTFQAGSLDGLQSAMALVQHQVAWEKPNSPGNVELLADKVSGLEACSGVLSQVQLANSLEDAMTRRAGLQQHQSIILKDGTWIGRYWIKNYREESASAGFIKRKEQLEILRLEIESLESELEACDQQYNEASARLVEAEEQIEQIRSRLNDTIQQANSYQSKVSALQARQDQLKVRMQKSQEEADELKLNRELELEKLEQSRDIWQQAMEQLNQFSDKRELLLHKRDEIRVTLDNDRQQARHQKDQAHQLQLQLQTSQNQKASLVQSSQRLTVQLSQAKERLQQLNASTAEGETPLEDMQLQLEGMLEARLMEENKLAQSRDALAELDRKLRELESERSRAEQSINDNRAALESLRMELQALSIHQESLIEQLNRDEFDVSAVLEQIKQSETEIDEPGLEQELEKLAARIQRLGAINLAAIDEYKTASERKDYLDAQNEDLEGALNTLQEAIRKIDKETRSRFKETFDKVNSGLQTLFPKVFGGGHAYLDLTDDDLLETGVSIMARPPGKKNATIHLLSGGEKALTAIALVFSIFQLNPAPFCMLDEVDAPLDDANVGRYANMVKEMSAQVQFIYITHNKIAMEMADQLMGVTMHEPGVSRLVSVDVEEAAALAAV